jgi:hypothetical protein
VTNTARDEGAIVLGWLTKLIVVLAVLGVLAYDGISILTANISTSDRASTLASEAADNVKSMKDINKAYAAAVSEAEAHGDTIAAKEFTVAPDGHVTLVLRTEAASLWMTHVGPLRHLLKVHATGEGTPSS